MLRRQPLHLFLAVLSTSVPFALSESIATLTISTFIESVAFFESVSTITEDGGVSVFTTTVRGREVVETSTIEDQVVISTITQNSTILIPTETVLITTIDHAATTPSSIPLSPSAEQVTQPDSGPALVPSASLAVATTTASTTSNIVNTAEQSSYTTHSGLSAGSKAGIAVGTILGVLLLAYMAYLCLKARSEARPRSSTLGLNSWSDDGYNTSPTVTSEYRSPTLVTEKQRELAHSESKQEPVVEPEEMIHPAYVVNSGLSENMNLTGIVYEDRKDQPMYIGVPAHLTGSKRWSVPKA